MLERYVMIFQPSFPSSVFLETDSLETSVLELPSRVDE